MEQRLSHKEPFGVTLRAFRSYISRIGFIPVSKRASGMGLVWKKRTGQNKVSLLVPDTEGADDFLARLVEAMRTVALIQHVTVEQLADLIRDRHGRRWRLLQRFPFGTAELLVFLLVALQVAVTVDLRNELRSMARAVSNLERQGVRDVWFSREDAARASGEWSFGRIIYRGDLLFESGKIVLRPEARDGLSKVAEIVSAKYPGSVVHIGGHAASRPVITSSPRFRDAWEFGFAAAHAVFFRLTGEGVAEESMRIHTSGDSEPRIDTPSEEARRFNQRVEIWLER